MMNQRLIFDRNNILRRLKISVVSDNTNEIPEQRKTTSGSGNSKR